jgi:hypothetical protein
LVTAAAALPGPEMVEVGAACPVAVRVNCAAVLVAVVPVFTTVLTRLR